MPKYQYSSKHSHNSQSKREEEYLLESGLDTSPLMTEKSFDQIIVEVKGSLDFNTDKVARVPYVLKKGYRQAWNKAVNNKQK